MVQQEFSVWEQVKEMTDDKRKRTCILHKRSKIDMGTDKFNLSFFA